MNLADLDLRILEAINRPFSPTLNFLFVVINYSSYVFLIFLMFYIYRSKNKNRLIHLIVNSVIGIFFVYFLKYSVWRKRPEISPIIYKADPSFPSSHSFVSFISLSFLPREFSLIAKLLSAIYLIFLVPFSLMYVGIHYPSDIVVGALLGLLFPKFISEKLAIKIIQKIYNMKKII
jgi:undecaprenyl-diphosphatase